MEPTPNSAPRSTKKKVADKPSDNVRLEPAANRQLTTHSKKLKISKTKYASAAVAYFAETGLNPTKERPHGLANVSSKVAVETQAVKELNVEIANRIISILRNWEQALYGFMQQQQAGTLNYLEQIESNILAHQVQVESSYFAPMIEQLIKANLEAYIGRGFAAQLLMKSTNQPEGSYQKQMEVSDNGRDTQLTLRMREFITTNSVAKPKLSPKPQILPVPPKAPSKQAGEAPAAGGAKK